MSGKGLELLWLCLDLLHGAGAVFLLGGYDRCRTRKRCIEILIGGSFNDGFTFSQLPIKLSFVIPSNIFQQLCIDLNHRQFIQRILVIFLHLNSMKQIRD